MKYNMVKIFSVLLITLSLIFSANTFNSLSARVSCSYNKTQLECEKYNNCSWTETNGRCLGKRGCTLSTNREECRQKGCAWHPYGNKSCIEKQNQEE